MSMTNAQCQAYAVIALRNLIKAGVIVASDNIYHIMDHELYTIFDTVSEEEAEEKAARILQGMVK